MMTREGAIEFGNMWLQMNEDCKDTNTYAFFQMAVKALEQGSVFDKIRADIIALAEGWNGMQAKNVPLGAVLKIIDKHTSGKEE